MIKNRLEGTRNKMKSCEACIKAKASCHLEIAEKTEKTEKVGSQRKRGREPNVEPEPVAGPPMSKKKKQKQKQADVDVDVEESTTDKEQDESHQGHLLKKFSKLTRQLQIDRQQDTFFQQRVISDFAILHQMMEANSAAMLQLQEWMDGSHIVS